LKFKDENGSRVYEEPDLGREYLKINIKMFVKSRLRAVVSKSE